MKLLDSSDPVISRTFDIPSWFTFQQLHYTIQYGMGPWQCYHLHQFTFKIPNPPPRHHFSRTEVLRILPASLFEDEDIQIPIAVMPVLPNVPKELERKVTLKDAFDPAGRLRSIIAPNDEILPLYYLYDFGDCWEHELIFKGEKLAREARPIFTAATGCAPVEDSGAVHGWNRVKTAFSARNPTKEQHETRSWAREVSGLGQEFDPFKEPDIIVMNYEGRWENHLEYFEEQSAEDSDN